MSRWIDADAVIARIAGQMSYEIEVETGNETDCLDLAEELLNDIPSIDIVRCKECKWLRYCETEDLDVYLDCDCPDGGGIPRNEEWFCADGERRER